MTVKQCPGCDGREIESVSNGWYCPLCKEGWDDFEILHIVKWETLNFPVWVNIEHYGDNHEFLRNFQRKVEIDVDEIPDYVDSMKMCTFDVWFKVENGGTISGPYAKEGDEKTIYE